MPKNTEKMRQKDITQARAKAAAQRKQLFLRLMEDCRGVISYTCHRTDISRATIYRWRREDADFAEKIDEIQKQFAPDMVESKLLELIEGVFVMTDEGLVYKQPPDIRAIKLFLEGRAQHRGYGQRFRTAKPANQEVEAIATGRPDEVHTATSSTLFRVSGDLGASGAEMTKAIEHVATSEELALLKNVFERARKYLAESGTLKPLSPNK